MSFMSTPCIGIEFPDVDLVDWLEAPNSDGIIRDLAIIIARRGVVFFRAQTKLTGELQKKLMRRLGQLSGSPKENGLYRHPFSQMLGDIDPEISAFSSPVTENNCNKEIKSRNSSQKSFRRSTKICSATLNALKGIAKLSGLTKDLPVLEIPGKRQPDRLKWHSDMTFEQDPPDFSSLRMINLPKNGGDTLWASSYGLYEKLPEPAKLLLENLTATHSQPVLKAIAEAKKNEVFEGPRGSPNNVGTTMEAVHPLVRTHPITGWRSVFAPGTDILHDGRKDEIGLTLNRVVINEVTANTSQLILNRLMSIMTEDHDIQVRFKWKSPSDIAIWDNRSTCYALTPYTDGHCRGWRVLGVGEKPSLNPESMSRAEALEESELKSRFSIDSSCELEESCSDVYESCPSIDEELFKIDEKVWI
ncbi:hypothetical protein MMC14_009826 [Varicellaria rhodocarpa]|nr:hypothetical protein [Varicellaria rhodocarpa]